MPDKKDISLVANKILGEEKKTSLENRTISGVCLICSLIFLSAIPLTIFLNSPKTFTLVYLFLTCIYGIFYLMTRFWEKSRLVVWLMVITCCSYISFLWFFDGGISGAANTVSLLAVILVSPMPDDRQRKFFILFILIVQGILHFTQFFYPDLIQAYQSLEDQFRCTKSKAPA